MKTSAFTSAAGTHWLKILQRFACALIFTGAAAGTVHAQTSWNWNGNQDGNWANPFNWSTNSGGGVSGLPQGYLNFPSGATRLINTNNFAAGSAGFQIYFNNGVGAGTNWGNSLTMYDWGGAAPVIENDSANAQTVNFPVVFQPAAANLFGRLEPNSGNLTLNSTVTMNNNNGTGQFRVTLGSSSTKLTLNGGLGEANGTGASFALNSAATVVFGAANTYAGDTFINSGTLVLAANSAVTNTSFVRLGNTTGSSGANLNVNGGITLSAKINVRNGSSGSMVIANSSGTAGAATFANNLFLDYPVTLYANSGGGNVLSGATLDLKAQTLTADGPGTNYITGALTNSTGSGSLVKNNAPGLLTLAGINTYSGSTTINAGELVGVTSGSCSNSAVTVASGATNGVALAAAATSWACSSLTYSSGTPYADFVFNNIAPSTTVAPINVLGNLAFTGTPTFLVRGTAIPNGQYPLIKYAGTLSGTPPTSATFIVPTGLGASVSNNVANKSIDLVVTNGTSVYWAVGNATWDINTTANWKDINGTSEKYLDNDSVTLDDTASGATPITVSLGTTVTPASITVNSTNKNYTISPASATGLFTGGGPLVKNGTGTLTVGTTNSSYAGTITVNGGTLALSGAASLGTGTLTLGNGTTFSLPSSGNAFPANPIFVPAGATPTITSAALGNGIGGFITSGDSTSGLTISGTPSFNSTTTRQFDPFTGTVTINSGATVRFSNTAGVNGGTNATFIDNGLLQTRNAGATIVLGALGGSGTVGPNQSVAGSGTTTYQVGTNNASTAFSGKLVDYGAGTASPTNTALVKLGTGTMTVSGNSPQTGPTTVAAGALIGVTGGSFSNSPVTVNAGATNGVNINVAGGQWTCTNLTYGAGTEYAVLNFGANAPSSTVGPLSVQNNLAINGVLNISVSGSSTAMSVGTYPLIKYAGTQTGFAVTNPLSLPLGVSGIITNDPVNKWVALIVTNSVTPALVWNAGNGNWDFSSLNWTNPLAGGGLTIWSNINYLARFDDTAQGAGSFTVTLNTNVNPLAVLVTNNVDNYTLTGTASITGSGTLTKTGPGSLTLLTTNTFSGGIALNGGTLQGNSATLLGTISDNAALVFNQSVYGSNNATITGTGSVTMQNSGTLVLGGNNTYIGGTVINGGVLAIGAGANLGGAPAIVVTNQITINGGTLLATNGAATVTLPSNSGITVGASGATINVATNMTLDYPQTGSGISGAGALTISGGGTFETDESTVGSGYASLTLNGATIAFNKSGGGLGNGPLIINGGTIRTTSTTPRSPNNSSVTVNADFTLGSATSTNISFSNGGSWTLANGNRTINVNGITATITGVVGDGGNNYQLIKAGSGTLALANADTFGGGISMTAGALNLGNNAAAGTGNLVSWSGGTIQVGNGVTITNGFDNPTTSTSDLMMDCPTGSGTWSGPVTSSGSGGFRPGTTGGTLTFTGSGAMGNRSLIVVYGNVQFGGTANFNNTGNANCLGRDGGGLGRTANITWMNNSVGAFPGFSLGGGKAGGNVTLTVQDSASLSAGTGNVDLNAVTTATAANVVNLNGGTLTAGGFVKSQTGASQTATLKFNGGTVTASQGNASFLPALSGLTAIVSTGGGTLNNGGFNLTVAQPLTHDSTLGTTADGGLTFSGTGTTTLAGTNNYSGLTVVNNGTLLLTGSLGTNAVTVNSTLAGTGTVNGAATVNFGGTLAPGLGGTNTSTLTISNKLALAGNALFIVDRTNAQNSSAVAGLSSVTYGGTLTVTNIGPALQAGDTFTLFSAAAYSGGFTNVILPSLTGGLVWYTNNLPVNGAVTVISPVSVAVTQSSTNGTYGINVALMANATGYGALTYQWYDYNTNAISGATNAALTLTNPAVAASGNYSVIVTSPYGNAGSLASVTISPAVLNITANNDTKTYGQAKVYGAGSTAFSSVGLQNGESIGSVTIVATGGTSPTDIPGNYALTPSAATGGTFNPANYNITYNNGTLTVGAANLSITANSDTKTYGQTKTYGVGSTAFMSVGLQNGESIGSVTITASGGTAATDAVGGYNLTPSAATGGTFNPANYNITYDNGTLTVNPLGVTVTANGQTKVYGATDPALTYSVSPALVGSDNFSGSLSRATGEAVGSHAISQGSLSLSANYTLTYAGANLVITPASLTVTADSTNKVYGQTVTFAGTEFGAAGLTNGDSVTSVTLSSDGATNTAQVAGSDYAILVTNAVGSGLGNYNISYVNGSLAVGPASLGVMADNQSRLYGATNPVFTATITGFVNGESLTNSDVVGAPDLATPADTNSPVGNYVITNSLGSLASTNYSFSLTNGTLAVAAAAITVTADNKSQNYGDPTPALTYTYSGFVNGDTAAVISGTPALSTGTSTNSPVGSYTITNTAGSLSATNYTFTPVNGTLMINPAGLTITANDDSKTYDGNAYSGGNGVMYSGFVNGETSGVLSGTLSYGGTSQGAINAGMYTIIPSGLTAGNYNITYNDGTLTVSQLVVNVTADGRMKTYGQADPALTYTFSPALVNGDSFSGSLSRAAGENVGSHAIGQGTLALSSNYVLNYTGANLVIGAANLSITANSTSKTYGQNLTFAGTEFSTSGLQFSDSVGSAALASAGTGSNAAAGNYTITIGSAVGAGLGNYNITYNNGTLTVNPASLRVSADNQSRGYGTTNPVLTAAITGFVNGESRTNSDVAGSPTVSTTADTNSPVGTYDITVSQGTLTSTNYTFSFTNGTLTVAPATITVTADNQTMTYGGPVPALSASYSGFLNGDTAAVISGSAVLSTTADTNSPVGNYTITAAQGTLNATNYAFATVNGTLSVTPAALSVTANNDSKTYNGNAYSGGNGVVYSGFVNGETSGVLSGTPSYGGTSQGAVNAGTYTIVPSGLTSSNYDITYHGGTLTISQLVVNATADGKTKTYGQADPPLTYQFSPSLVMGDSFSGALSRATGEAVGSHAIGQGSLSLSANYTLTYAGANLVITPANLTVTASNRSKAYGQTVTFAGTEFSVSGLTNGDSVSSVALGSAGATNNAAVGGYPIVPSAAVGSGLGNYNISYVNGTLTVTAATPVTLLAPVLLGDGSVQLSFSGGDAEVNYEIQVTTDLGSAGWMTLTNIMSGTNGIPSVTDTDATNHAIRFYRTVVP